MATSSVLPQQNLSGAGPARFLKEVRDELRLVYWPTREQVVRLTVIVIAVSIAVGLFVGGLDFILTSTLDKFLRR